MVIVRQLRSAEGSLLLMPFDRHTAKWWMKLLSIFGFPFFEKRYQNGSQLARVCKSYAYVGTGRAGYESAIKLARHSAGDALSGRGLDAAGD